METKLSSKLLKLIIDHNEHLLTDKEYQNDE